MLMTLFITISFALKVLNNPFYVDYGLTGANTCEKAIELQQQLQNLFQHGHFLLCKWNSNDPFF